MTDRVALVRTYYDALDTGAYDRFESLLAPEFAHRRPDRSLVGREAFIGFVREDRPQGDTTHEIKTVYDPSAGESAAEVAVRGSLRGADGEEILAFVDVFRFDDNERLVELNTYTR